MHNVIITVRCDTLGINRVDVRRSLSKKGFGNLKPRMNADLKLHCSANIWNKKHSYFAFFANFAVKKCKNYQHFNIFFGCADIFPKQPTWIKTRAGVHLDRIYRIDRIRTAAFMKSQGRRAPPVLTAAPGYVRLWRAGNQTIQRAPMLQSKSYSLMTLTLSSFTITKFPSKEILVCRSHSRICNIYFGDFGVTRKRIIPNGLLHSCL